MIITRTPFRISFFGGGTDYPAWFKDHGGVVLTTSIDKYCYIALRPLPPFFSHKHRIVYSKVEEVTRAADIQHPVVRAILGERGEENGLEIHHDGDLPARSGLGSSSAFTVGFLNAMNALEGRMTAKNDLAVEAIRIEQDVLKENVGCQDQIAVAYGGFNRIEIAPNGTFDVTPVIMPRERLNGLQDSLMLFFTGISRFSSEIAAEQIKNIGQRKDSLHAMRGMVDAGLDVLLNSSDLAGDFGALLHENWMLKKSLASSVSTPLVDDLYDAARSAGAIGGKLLGAGGGGFILFVVKPERRNAVRQRLSQLLNVNFRFEYGGSKIVLFEPQGLNNV